MSGGSTIVGNALDNEILIYGGIVPGRSKVTVNGGAGNDTISGGYSNTNQVLLGGAGNDYLSSRVGADSLNGGDGDDLLFARSGNDSVTAGAGNDSLQGKAVTTRSMAETELTIYLAMMETIP